MTDGKGAGAWARVRARVLVAAGAVAAAVAAVVLVWFQPQVLLYDTVVDEALPAAAPEASPDARAAEEPDAAGAAPGRVDEQEARRDGDPGERATERADPGGAPETPAGSAAADGEDPPAEPERLAAAAFASRNRYTVEGGAAVYELADGARVLRLEDFSSTNGPDLFVYLTAAESTDPDTALAADFVDLGELAGNVGNQNYAVPEDVDLDRYGTVVIWCRRFSVSFGAADLAPSGR